MRKLFASIVFTLFIVYTGDFLLSERLWDNSAYSYSGNIRKLHYECTGIDEDFIIFGSSRCNYHYAPSIIADTLGCSVYNAGWNGTRIVSHYYLLQQILAVHTPKYICLDITPSDYAAEQNPFKELLQYAPCFGRVPRADSIFRDSGDYPALCASRLYRYNANMQSYIHALLFHQNQPDDDNGFIPLAETEAESRLSPSDQTPVTCDSLKLRYLEQFVQECRKKQIQLFFSISPLYSTATDDMYEPAVRIADKYDIPVFNYHTRRLFHNDSSYFRDSYHLCKKGAYAFSSIFAHEMKQYIHSHTEE